VKRQQRIITRIQDFGAEVGISVGDILSVKFRPTNQDLPDEDKTTLLPAELYGEPPGLSDIEDSLMDKIGPDTSAPMKAIKWYGPSRKLLWIPHETGLEVLGATATVIGAVAGLIKIYEFFRAAWKNYNQRVTNLPARQVVTHMTVETRWFNDNGTLVEKVVLTKNIQQEFGEADQVQVEQVLQTESYK
jgi:hypothetical protein